MTSYFAPKLKIVITSCLGVIKQAEGGSTVKHGSLIVRSCYIVTIVTLLPWLVVWYGCIVLISYTRYDKILWVCLEWYTLSLNGLYSCTEYMQAIYKKYFEFWGWLCGYA